MASNRSTFEIHRVTLARPDDFEGWRDAARNLAEAGVRSEDVAWQVEGGTADLFANKVDTNFRQGNAPSFPVARGFVDLARMVICHTDPERFNLLYTMLLRLRVTKHALDDQADPLVRKLRDFEKAVRREIHKMHAFVRFREVDDRFVAFFAPEHHIVREAASFFVNRFTAMNWSILTPELGIHWDGHSLSESPGALRSDAPAGDALEEMWRTYYASIFNPARLKVGAMLKEMPKRYWRDLPEAALIQPLIATARSREIEMIEQSLLTRAKEEVHAPGPETRLGEDPRRSWEALLAEARGCTRCPLHRCATQTVFGEGPLDAKIMLVGEQPGDQEDLAGRPFIGPAGHVLDLALEEAGIKRDEIYITNAIKHFKFERRGKKRIHSSPGAGEIASCKWWLDQERALVRPLVTLALGVTAARSLFGKPMAIGKNRDAPLSLPDGSECWITVHPSFLLRISDQERREVERAEFVRDLRRVKERVERLANRGGNAFQ